MEPQTFDDKDKKIPLSTFIFIIFALIVFGVVMFRAQMSEAPRLGEEDAPSENVEENGSFFENLSRLAQGPLAEELEDGEQGGGGSEETSTDRPRRSSRETRAERERLENIALGRSPWYGMVTISRGNASSEYQPYREYISITARSRNDVALPITGWILENGAGERYYQVGQTAYKGTASRAVIPNASLLYFPTPFNATGPVLLQPGERAVLVSGSPLPVTRYPLTSFKVNKCMGYIEEMDNVRFYPSLPGSCPNPRSYEGVEYLEQSCYDFVRRLNRCHTPVFEDLRLPNGGFEAGAVDGVIGLTNQCKAFIRDNFNYSSCVANHIQDKDFYKKEWRIFLGSRWELWAKNRETIRLLDAQGRLVAEREY